MTKLLVVVGVLAACGGANLNRRGVGNQDGGIRVRDYEIAVAPRGDRVVVRLHRDVLVGDVATHTLVRIPDIADPKLLAFWAGAASGMFVLTERELVSYDLEAGQIAWRRPVASGAYTRLDVTPDGKRVVATGADVVLLDAATGADAGRFAPGTRIEDVDVTPDGERVIVTERERWTDGAPTTAIHVVAASSGERLCTAVVPNCADELIVDARGDKAYLSPTACRKDPVSIVDITASCKFEKNLPGFGPIALTPDGATGVAFLDRDAIDPTAPPRPAEVDTSATRFHLMLFDTHTHELSTIPIGNELPRYALTPDGKTLVVDGLLDAREAGKSELALVAQPVRLVDLETRSVRTVAGPSVLLNAFVTAPDSRSIWLVHSDLVRADKRAITMADLKLYRIDIAAARIEQVPTPVAVQALNMLPGMSALLLRDELALHLFDPGERRITATFGKRVQDASAGTR